MSSGPFAARSDHVLVSVRLTPNARDDRIEELRALADGRTVLAVRVRAVPAEGAANVALERLVAETADVARSRVSIVSGHSQRLKTVRIEGPGEAIAARLRAVL
jgi:uncharacterized protein (TIGR00251 family)